MKTKHLLPVVILMELVLLLALAGNLPGWLAEQNRVTIGIPSGEGYAVTGVNPVTVKPGEDAVFDFAVAEGYVFRSAEMGSYENGKLTIHGPQRSQTIYPQMGKMCSITTGVTGNGRVELLTAGTVLDGETASVRITPEENYIVERITVEGREYPVPADNILSFTVEDHSDVQVEFAGKSVTFMAMSGNLGTVEIQNETSDFRYGDVLQLRCQFDEGFITFDGWSTGDFLQSGGVLLSGEPDFDFTITENTVLYANFTNRSTFWVRYDSNLGQQNEDLGKEYSPGEYIHLAQDRGYFTREGYCLLEYNTQPDGSGQRYGLGAMMEVPAQDITLFAQWAQETDPAYLSYTRGGTITVTGLSEAGKAAGLTRLVIPATINGTKVTAIAANAFCDIPTLEQAVVPLGVTSIGGGAFSRCEALTTLYLPETLRSMGSGICSRSPNFTTLRVLPNLNMVFDRDYDSALADKYMRLKNSTGKRLILVAGSSLSFGLDSEMLAQRFPGYTVVNFSCSMYYGILPLFDILRANVREGDVVVFAPEYDSSMYAATEQKTMYNWQYLESNYDILEDIDLRNNPAIFNYFGRYLSEKRGYLPGKKVNANNVYLRSAFNAAGDLMSHRTNRGKAGFHSPDRDVIQKTGMERYNALCAELTGRGASCYFSYPPQPSGGCSKEYMARHTAAFEEKLASMLDSRYCTIISEMPDYFLDSQLFYDTNYHLTLEGAKVRTQQLIEDLAPYMDKED